MSTSSRVGVRLVRIASVYLLAGLVLGLVMGIGKDFSLMSVHTHVLLLGWATLALTGIVYLVLPACAGTRLAAETLGEPRADPFVGLGSTIVVAGLGLFTLNVLRNAGASEAARP